MLYGAAGGAIVELLRLGSQAFAWQKARQKAATKLDRPPLMDYYDPPSDALCMFWRALLGCIAGWAFHTQVTGFAAMIAAGAAAPATLRKLGEAKTQSEQSPSGMLNTDGVETGTSGEEGAS
ncbi:hypothetical protein [Streptomyces sp. NBC_00273]|uniref:hypothetical protein n=1 Tax=Streptomyces sp. NBC_00273 TaxID=2903644 RepID=UPI002E2A4569|nr:hypothetical protein [Streptomyces sp. NBC_00273]